MTAVRLIGLLAAGWSASVLAAGPLPLRVTADRVILRASAHPEGEIVGQVMAGDVLATPDLLTTQSWVRVAAPPSVDLWVYTELVRDGRIAVNKVQIRGGPGIQFARVGELERDAPVTIRGTAGDWTRIAPPAGCHLWIHRDFVAPILPPAPDPPPTVAESDKSDPSDPSEPVGAPSGAAPAATNTAVAWASAGAGPLRAGAATPPAPLPAVDAPVGGVPARDAPHPTPPPRAPRQPALPPLPPALAGMVADAHRPQHAARRFRGVRARVPYATGPRYSTFQLVAPGTGRTRDQVICRLIGLDGQLDRLVGVEVDAAGQAWHLAGEPIPVLDARWLAPSQPLDP